MESEMLCIACSIRIKSYKVDQKVVLMKILSDGFNDSFLNAFLNAGCIYLYLVKPLKETKE